MINIRGGTSTEVQWLRLRLPMQGVWVPSLVGDLRSHMPCGVATKNKKIKITDTEYRLYNNSLYCLHNFLL